MHSNLNVCPIYFDIIFLFRPLVGISIIVVLRVNPAFACGCHFSPLSSIKNKTFIQILNGFMYSLESVQRVSQTSGIINEVVYNDCAMTLLFTLSLHFVRYNERIRECAELSTGQKLVRFEKCVDSEVHPRRTWPDRVSRTIAPINFYPVARSNFQ